MVTVHLHACWSIEPGVAIVAYVGASLDGAWLMYILVFCLDRVFCPSTVISVTYFFHIGCLSVFRLLNEFQCGFIRPCVCIFF